MFIRELVYSCPIGREEWRLSVVPLPNEVPGSCSSGLVSPADCEFDRNAEDARSRKRPVRLFARLGRRCVTDYSDSFERWIPGCSGILADFR